MWLAWIAVATGLVASIIVITEFVLSTTGDAMKAPLQVAYAIGRLPTTVMYTLSADSDHALTPVERPDEKGKPLHVLDLMREVDGTELYILLEDERTSSSDLFKKNPSGSVTRLTTSSTLKYNLTYDPLQQVAVYQSSASTSPQAQVSHAATDITAYSFASGTERVIAQGSDPVFVAGGGSLILVQDNAAKRIAIATRTLSPELIHVADPRLFSIDAKKGVAVSYNTTTQMLDRYQISATGIFNYVSSEAMASDATGVHFLNSELYVAERNTRTATSTLTVTNTHTGNVLSLPTASAQAELQRIREL